MIYKTIDEWIEHNPNHRGLLPIEVCHQIWGTKDNEKPWVGLTQEEVEEVERWVEFKEEGSGRIPMGKLVAYISEKLRSKNA